MPSGSSSSRSERADSNNANDHQHAAVISPKLEFVILLSLLAGLIILAIRPFGFRTFLHDMAHGELYPMIIVFGIIAVILVLMQRFGIIFAKQP